MYKLQRAYFYILKFLSFIVGPFNRGKSLKLLRKAYEKQGVKFRGTIGYIHPKAFIDNRGTIVLGENIVISTNAILLAHDFSSYVRKAANGNTPPKSVDGELIIGDNCFIGAGAIILPRTHIGNYCIIGAGSVVKGNIPDFSVVIGNPCKIIKKTNETK